MNLSLHAGLSYHVAFKDIVNLPGVGYFVGYLGVISTT